MPIIAGARGRGAANMNLDGSLGPFATEGAPSGLNGIAAKGAICTDITNAKLYINTGTLGTNTWTVVGTQT